MNYFTNGAPYMPVTHVTLPCTECALEKASAPDSDSRCQLAKVSNRNLPCRAWERSLAEIQRVCIAIGVEADRPPRCRDRGLPAGQQATALIDSLIPGVPAAWCPTSPTVIVIAFPGL